MEELKFVLKYKKEKEVHTMQTRREFLNTAWMGAAALAAGGCVTKWCGTAAGAMATYADKPFHNLRVGVIGLGRGIAGITGFTLVPGSYI